MNSPKTRVQLMPKDDFLRNMEEILKLPSGGLRGPELLCSFGEWDSLAILEFMAMVDRRLGVTLGVDSIAASETYDDLYALIES